MSDLRSAVEALRRAVVMDWGPTVESAVAIIDAHQCLPSRGRIRIRTSDDKPGHWTAQGDLVPGVPYTYWSGDVVVVVDWKGAHQCLPSDPEDRWRLIRVSTDLLSQFGTRTEDGRAITAEWGEPDADGIYEPVFTVSGDAHQCLPSEEELAEALR